MGKRVLLKRQKRALPYNVSCFLEWSSQMSEMTNDCHIVNRDRVSGIPVRFRLVQTNELCIVVSDKPSIST